MNMGNLPYFKKGYTPVAFFNLNKYADEYGTK